MPSISPISGTLGRERAAHLLRRCTFGASASEIELFANSSLSECLDILFQVKNPPNPPIDPATGKTWLPKPLPENSGDDSLMFSFKAWWIDLMRDSGSNLTERMTYFWHTHMPAHNEIIRNATAIYYQNQLYRHFALGNFKKMFTKVTADNAMLVYIDNTLNDYGSPNENYAREMFELYSIGKGQQIGAEDYTNYTETDIKAAARILTGIKHNFEFDTIDPETLLPRGKLQTNGAKQAYRHDAKPKTFSAKFGQKTISPKPELMIGEYASEEGVWDEVSQLMDMIFAQAETAKFICRKLYRFFVFYQITPEVERDIITPLAETLRTNDYEIVPTLRQLFSSEHFYDMDSLSTRPHIGGALIKSPMEILLGTLRIGKVKIATEPIRKELIYKQLIDSLELMGLDFYKPIDVAGYPPYHQEPVFNRNWISPNYLARRYEFGHILVQGFKDPSNELLLRLDVVNLIRENISEPSDPRTLVQELVDLLLPQSLSNQRFNYFLNDLLLYQLPEEHWRTEWEKYIGTNDDTAIRSQLQHLIIGLLQSPEYQLF